MAEPSSPAVMAPVNTIPLNPTQRQRLLVLQSQIDQLTALRNERLGAILTEHGCENTRFAISPDGSSLLITSAASEEGQSMTA